MIPSHRILYGALGAGPGPTRTYRIDAPLPWGPDTPITLPTQAIADDFAAAIAPQVNQAIAQISSSVKASVAEGISQPLQSALASGNLVVQQASTMAYAVVGAVGVAVGWIAAKTLRRIW